MSSTLKRQPHFLEIQMHEYKTPMQAVETFRMGYDPTAKTKNPKSAVLIFILQKKREPAKVGVNGLQSQAAISCQTLDPQLQLAVGIRAQTDWAGLSKRCGPATSKNTSKNRYYITYVHSGYRCCSFNSTTKTI